MNVSMLRQGSDDNLVIYFHLLDELKVLNSLHLEILLNIILRSFRFSNKNFLDFRS